MALTFERPWALLLLPALAVLLFLLARQRGARGLLALGLRMVIVSLLVLGLAGPTRAAERASTERLIILVDRSASVSPAALAEVENVIRAAQTGPPETLVVQFAARPQLVSDPAAEWPAPDGRDHATDLAAALDFAGQLLTGQPGRILLVSDGAATTGDTLAAADRLARAGLPVDIWPLLSADAAIDAAVESVVMPAALWAGDPFSVTINLYSRGPASGQLSVLRDGQPLTELALDLLPGENHIALSVLASAEGLTAFEARVTVDGDERPQNDFGGAVGLVRPAPRVLMVAQRPEAALRLRAALAASNIGADIITPAELPADVSALSNYQVMLLVDVSADRLSLEQMALIDSFVYSEGRGLVVAGGPTSYSLGKYQQTPLERLLPVSLETPERGERPPANLLLIVDHSGSMTGEKMALAREAAMRAVEILQPQDRIGVLAFNHEYHWRVPLDTIGQGSSLRGVLDGISNLFASGGTDILTPLEVGINALRALPPGAKHIVLLSDGESMVGAPPDFRLAVEAGLEDEITVSTIAIGSTADTALMSNIADWGSGRFHYALSPESLPRMVLAESQSVRSEAVQRGTVRANISQQHPLVSGFTAADFPPLEAYVALKALPNNAADVVVVTPLGDPLLAAWQYGLGRVVAWTSDLADVWTPEWERWPGLGRFWAQLVRYALPDPAQGSLIAEAAVSGPDVQFSVQATGDDGRGVNLASVQVVVSAPDGSRSRVDLVQTAPGEYAAAFSAPGPGAYRGLAVLSKDGQQQEAPLGFVVSYSPEFSPRLPAGFPTLSQVASLTGGSILAELDLAAAARVEESGSTSDAGLWLVLAGLVLWPFEIAIRRRWMPWKP